MPHARHRSSCATSARVATGPSICRACCGYFRTRTRAPCCSLLKGVRSNLYTGSFRLTMDIFAEISFGVDFDSVRMQGEHEFSQAFDEVQCFC